MKMTQGRLKKFRLHAYARSRRMFRNWVRDPVIATLPDPQSWKKVTAIVILASMVLMPIQLDASFGFYMKWYAQPTLYLIGFVLLLFGGFSFLAQLEDVVEDDGKAVPHPKGGVFEPRPNRIYEAIIGENPTGYYSADKNISIPKVGEDPSKWKVVKNRPDGRWDRGLGNYMNEVIFDITGSKFFGWPLWHRLKTMALYYPEAQFPLKDETGNETGKSMTVGFIIRKRDKVEDQHVQGNEIDSIDLQHSYTVRIPVDFKGGQSCFITMLTDIMASLPYNFFRRDGKGLEILYEAIKGVFGPYCRRIEFNDFLDDIVEFDNLNKDERGLVDAKIVDGTAKEMPQDDSKVRRVRVPDFYADKFIELMLSLNKKATILAGKKKKTDTLDNFMGYLIHSASYQDLQGDIVTQKLINAKTMEQQAERQVRITRLEMKSFNIRTDAMKRRAKVYLEKAKALQDLDPVTAYAIAMGDAVRNTKAGVVSVGSPGGVGVTVPAPAKTP